MSMRYPGGFIASTPVTANYPSGVWTQAQALPYQAQNVWTRDQFWPYTSLLLNGNGTNGAQNNTFLDSSTNNFTITRNGNTTQGSFTPYETEGYWSNYFDGTGDYLSVADNNALDLSGDFTIELFFNISGGSTSYPRLVAKGPYNAATSWGVNIDLTSNSVYFEYGVQPSNLGGGVFVRNTWNHVAVVRSGTSLSIFLNGNKTGTATTSANFTDTNPLSIGALTLTTDFIAGYISNLRIVKGTAVYTANFTPPTVPLTAITNTSLLTCQSNRFKDNSTNAFAITRNGDVSVQSFQPFPGATTYSGTVLGGSGYFDGTGDYLTIPRTSLLLPGSGVDFTVEAWVYWTTLNNVIIGSAYELGGAADWALFAFGRFFIQSVNTSYDSSIGLNPYSWNHIAVSRSSNTLRIFVNGQIGFSGTVSASLSGNGTGPISIGADQNGDEGQLSGYISQIRFVNGTALYTAAFTPPTAPFTAVTNTQLLLNFTNAGIADSATMNDLETVGNAQVSTSVVKYGTGSMAFDGTGDYLFTVSSVNLQFGTGDFTIEFWWNPSTLATFQPLIYHTNDIAVTGAGEFVIVYNTTLGMRFFLNAGAAGTVSQGNTSGWAINTWYHVAVVKTGGTLTIYRDGVSIASGANTATVGAAVPTYIGGQPFDPAYSTGYIDDLRITKGVARYITNFTPPPARLPGQ